ncbi:MAG: hypothetical protein GX130_08700 [Candidatus Hydrogenedens sp.]|jgi:uncharacterized phage infection (PIP) family protein YhgE|nr:hypothetical protein [Candidatus Hydrogenedens sp.]
MVTGNSDSANVAAASLAARQLAEYFEQCVSSLAQLDGSFSSEDLILLLSALVKLLRGISFLSDGDEQVNKQLELFSRLVYEKNETLKLALEKRSDYQHQLQLLQRDIDSVSEEIKKLEVLNRFSALRDSVAAFASETRPYLKVLGSMSKRASSDAAHLKELEKECVERIDKIEACLKQKLEDEEKQWESARQKAL